MINITENNKVDCCGCWACVQACPTKCISMSVDNEGFKYPVIDKNKCINCNKCERVCPIIVDKNNDHLERDIKLKTVGGWHKDEEVLKKSSSGGAFTLFAEWVLKNNGVVFGAGFNNNMEVSHLGIERIDELDKLRGSKYVQSEIGDTYLQVKKVLDNDRFALFVGTACQVAGLSSFLNKKYDKLFTCDFVCHGVPSPLVFKKYINYLEEENKQKIVEFKFRNKDMNWRQSGQQMGTAIKFENGNIKRFMPAYKDKYMNGFLSDIFLRPACHDCRFKSLPKDYSDITIADFWGVKSINSELNNKKGTSLVIFNTEHGEALFEKVNKNFYFKECDFKNSIRRNQTLIKSSRESSKRGEFFKDLNNNKSFRYMSLKYMTALSWVIERGKKFLLK